LNIANVAKQRQLNDQGRALARAIGEALRKLKVPAGQVVTSQFNRAVETGTLLGFGSVTSTTDISEGGLVVTPTENNRPPRR
jgi:phosphohistidine phosphatase SixA